MSDHREKQLRRFLLESPLLRPLPPNSGAVRRFLASVELRLLKRGEVLYEEGDAAPAFFLVRHGEIHRFHREPAGEPRLIGIHGRGSVLGEVSFLAGERHGARALAALDSQIVRIPSNAWMALIREEPEALSVLVQIISRRFHRTLDPDDQPEPARLNILAYPDNPKRGRRMAGVLARVLVEEIHGPVLLLELSGIEEGDQGADVPWHPQDAEGEGESPANLDAARSLADTSILARPVELFEWLRSRSRTSNEGFDFIDGSPLLLLPEKGNRSLRDSLPALLGIMRKFYSMVLIHVGHRMRTDHEPLMQIYQSSDVIACARDASGRAGPRWVEFRRNLSGSIPDFFDRLVSVSEEHQSHRNRRERNPDRSVPLKQNRIRLFLNANGELSIDSPGIHRLGRKLSGKLRGLSLGGGGARAYAHAGVLETLEEERLEFDGIAGTSMGAVIGAAHAAGIPAREIQLLLRKNLPDSAAILDKGLPLVSFYRGDRLNQVLMDVFGELQFEDLQIPFYCNSTDLNSGDSLIFESGYVSMALRASVSIPGVFPPVQMPPYTLVDGGILNNLPGDVLRQRGFSRVAGINVTPMSDDRSSQTHVDFSEGVGGVWDYFSRPPVLSIITRSIAVEGRELMRFRLEDFDFILNPDIGPFDLFDFHKHDEIFEAGKKEAAARIGELWQAMLRH
ncbi:MAG: patatin-like phospholipase family protein [Leptospiraceae bacterium]|nr:patatin-like phospholipase family protein [Leptospiraceae bacterium]